MIACGTSSLRQSVANKQLEYTVAYSLNSQQMLCEKCMVLFLFAKSEIETLGQSLPQVACYIICC
jgi:hypothetical protein